MKTRLMEIRKAAGYKSRKEIADALGMNVHTYAYWETGRTDISASVICMLADFFGVTVDYLLGRDEVARGTYEDPRESELRMSFRSVSEDRKNMIVQVARDASTAEGVSQLAVQGGMSLAQGAAQVNGPGSTALSGEAEGEHNAAGNINSGNTDNSTNVTYITSNYLEGE